MAKLAALLAVLAGVLVGSGVAPASGELQITLVKPVAGSTVYGNSFKVVVRVVGGGGETIHVSLEADAPVASSTASGPDGTFTLRQRFNQAGAFTFTVNAQAGQLTGHLSFKLTVEPKVTAIQTQEGRLVAPGCRICVIRDPRGDNFGDLPDIVSASSKYSRGWLVHRIVTYGAITTAGGPTCLEASYRYSPNQQSHYGFGICSGTGGAHSRVLFGPCRPGKETCGSGHLAFPNPHTMVVRFRPSQIGNPRSYYWDVWVLYPGDQLKDAAPSRGGPHGIPARGSRAPYCLVRQEIRPDAARDYYFGKSSCSQRWVVKAVR